MSEKVNSIELFRVEGKRYRQYIIRELFCYRHPRHGYIVKKSYENYLILTTGAVPKRQEEYDRLIEAQKRKLARYNTTVTAPRDKPITDWWWEPPGEPGRFDDKGNRL